MSRALQDDSPLTERERVLSEILENLIIALKKAEMEASARLRIDVFGDPYREQPDPELESVPEIQPSRRCPKCWTYGHEHRKTCPFAGTGMKNHIPIEKQK